MYQETKKCRRTIYKREVKESLPKVFHIKFGKLLLHLKLGYIAACGIMRK